jgi:hypothetical protein
MRRRHDVRRVPAPVPVARVAVALAVAGLLAACLALGAGVRLAEPADTGGQVSAAATVAGDDLPAVVLPAVVALVITALVVGVSVLVAPRRSRPLVVATRGRAPPRPIDI